MRSAKIQSTASKEKIFMNGLPMRNHKISESLKRVLPPLGTGVKKF